MKINTPTIPSAALPPSPSPCEWQFVDELKSGRALCFHAPTAAAAPPGTLDLRIGVRFLPPPEELPGTAWRELRRSFQENPGGIELAVVRLDSLDSGEVFRLSVAPGRIEIGGNGPEAWRRGIYELQARAQASPLLACGVIERAMRIRNRIARGFFSPIKRPPFQLDELLDDVDYYPEAYLERLASEGINGLWITVKWREICATPFIAADPERDRRIAKLNRVIARCARYGIKVWAFAIEPAAWAPDDPLLRRYPELGGAPIGRDLAFCPSSAVAEDYLAGAAGNLFRSVENLGGILNITHGERATNCLTSLECTEDIPVDCPRCGRIPKPQIITNTLRPMYQGMIDAAPEAQLIAWFYMPQAAEHAPWVFDLPGAMPPGVILQYNCESNVAVEQLGRIRRGGDYWLSVPTPSADFVRIARDSARHHTGCCAKLQVACSHEVATVPFVPVPSLLFQKYRALRELGVEHVCQSWYFGNAPGLMNQAANLLSREPFCPDEDSFLLELTRPQWGDAAAAVIPALHCFARAYEHYPVSNQMQYYGPAHAGIAWPLHLRLTGAPLAPTWRPDFPPSGDTIGECLENHTLAEAVTLFGRLADGWSEGMKLLREIPLSTPEQERDFGVCRALELQFAGAHQILRFYDLRRRFLFDGERDVLPELEAIVTAEIDRSLALCQLARRDSRLGFHSEAERHIYFPELLEWRVDQLRQLLETDFADAGRGIVFPDRLPVPSLHPGSWTALPGLNFALRRSSAGFEVEVRFAAPEDPREVELVDLHWVDRAGVEPIRRVEFFRHRRDLPVNNCGAKLVAANAEAFTIRIPPEFSTDGSYVQIRHQRIDAEGRCRNHAWPDIMPEPAARLNFGVFAWRNCARIE